MKFSVRDLVLRAFFIGRPAVPLSGAPTSSQEGRFPPFFPDTSATRQGIVLVRIATWLMAAYAPLNHAKGLQPLAHLTRAGWIACAGIGLVFMGIGFYRAGAARVRAVINRRAEVVSE